MHAAAVVRAAVVERADKKSILTSIFGSKTLRVVEVRGNSDNGLLDLFADLGLSNLLHLRENHGGDLLGRELLLLSTVLDFNERTSFLVDDSEGPVGHVLLHIGIVITTTNQTLGVEDCLAGVHRRLVLGSITDQTLAFGEGDVGRCGTVTLCKISEQDKSIGDKSTTYGRWQ